MAAIDDPEVRDAIAAIYYRRIALQHYLDKGEGALFLHAMGITARDLALPERWPIHAAQVESDLQLATKYREAFSRVSEPNQYRLLKLVFDAIFVYQIRDADKKSPWRLRVEMLFRKAVREPCLYKRMILVVGCQPDRFKSSVKWQEVIDARLRLMRAPAYGNPPKFESALSGVEFPNSVREVIALPLIAVAFVVLCILGSLDWLHHQWTLRRFRSLSKLEIQRYAAFTPQDFLGIPSFSYLWERFGFEIHEADTSEGGETLKKELLNSWVAILGGEEMVKRAEIDNRLRVVYQRRGAANRDSHKPGAPHFYFQSAVDEVAEGLRLPDEAD